ncbi:MAG: hypothetical protein IK062_07950 [Selenomonadaceae bacterium]|nr:hypothetical protein [Selenomonadaceae bacterium]
MSLIRKNLILMLENMEDIIKLLREQTILCRRSMELFENLIERLKENSPDIIESVQKIEKITVDLNRNSIETQKFLQTNNFKNFSELLAAQEKNIQRNVAESLLNQSKNLQEKLRNLVEAASKLTEKGESFVNFNLNLMSKTQVDTYGADKLSEGQSNRRIVEFRC